MVTIYEIAEKCGVSVSTVSYILSGQGDKRRISVDTQALVQKTAAELGYVPRKRRKTAPAAPQPTAAPPVVAVYWPRRDFEMCMPPLTQGLNNALSKATVPVNISIRPYDQGHLGGQLQGQAPPCDAMLFVAGQKEDLAWLESHPPVVPSVLFNRSLPGYASVSVDHMEAARLAAEQGRDVFAVPADVLRPTSQGTLKLLRSGAVAVASAEDILSEYENAYPEIFAAAKNEFSQRSREQKSPSRSVPEHTPRQNDLRVKRPAPPGLSPEAKAVYAAVDFEPLSVDEISDLAKLSSGQTSAALTELEIFGLIRPVAGRRFRLE